MLKMMLNQIYKYIEKNEMEIITKKTQIMIFYKGQEGG